MSLLVHSIALVALVAWANPFDKDPEQEKDKQPDIVLSGDRMTELVEQVREIQQKALKTRLGDLQAIEYEMEQMRQALNEEYTKFSEQQQSEALERAVAAQEQALAAQQQAIDKQAAQDQTAAREQQIKAQAAMDEALTRMSVSPVGAAAMAAQELAKEAQTEADAKLDVARSASGALSKVERDTERDIKRREGDRNKRAKDLAKEEKRAEDLAKKVAEQESKQDKLADSDDKKARERVAKDVKKAKDEAAKQDKKVKSIKADVAKRQKDVDAKRAAAGKAIAERSEAAKAAAKQADKAQREAKARQEQALAKAKQAAEAASEQVVQAEDIRAPDMEQAFASAEDLVDVYQQSKAAEDRITERYRDLRAAELAMIRDIPFEQAAASIEVPKPERAELDATLLRKDVRNGAEAKAHEKQMETALVESAAMVNLATELLALLQEQQLSQQQGATVQVMREAAAAQDAVEQQVKEGKDTKSADVTEMMKQAAAKESGKPAESGGGKLVSYQVPHEEITVKDNPTPGRVITTRPDVPGAEWMYVDSWYTIGPFPNEGRRNIDTRFPPESVVDLDATYVGKGGKEISWHFQQATGPCVVPRDDESWAVYYAHTEVWVDRDIDLWLAVGSDDKSHIWVNGQLVWVSEPHHKPWRIGEGYRKIHLQKGRNRVLYRVENGQYGMGFSFILHVDPEKVG
ncbi:MAG: hypothetical protein PF961_17135 [Planctomycetota bacterium]|nr:hypothetical protein [Planctomycetota bacterium]